MTRSRAPSRAGDPGARSLNTWGVEMNRIPPSRPGAPGSYDPPLKRLEDIERLRLPSVRLSKEQTEAALARAHDSPRRSPAGSAYLRAASMNATICTVAAALAWPVPVDDRHDREPGLGPPPHGASARWRPRTMDQVEAMGLLAQQRGRMFCSDPIGPDPDGGPLTYANLWGCANSQEFDPVSPAMWEEFLLQCPEADPGAVWPDGLRLLREPDGEDRRGALDSEPAPLRL